MISILKIGGMQMGTIIVGAVVVVVAALAARSIYRDKKSGKACSGCSGGCAGCHGGCHTEQ